MFPNDTIVTLVTTPTTSNFNSLGKYHREKHKNTLDNTNPFNIIFFHLGIVNNTLHSTI